MTVREILDAALKLEPDERERLVEELTASLHGGFASDEVERSWLQEIDRRSQDIDAGTAELVDWPEAHERLAERRGRRPA
ncbi:MAG TPA: addiction module protein [Kofleriaceae bacterium]|nr:addiction module protein [Kofleriaceae bacterium]